MAEPAKGQGSLRQRGRRRETGPPSLEPICFVFFAIRLDKVKDCKHVSDVVDLRMTAYVSNSPILRHFSSDGQPVDSDKLRGFLTNLPDKKVLLSFSKCPLFLLRVVGMLKDNQFFPGGRDDPEPIKVYPKHVAACIWEFRNKLRDRYNEPVRFQEGDEGLRTYADRFRLQGVPNENNELTADDEVRLMYEICMLSEKLLWNRLIRNLRIKGPESYSHVPWSYVHFD